MKLFSIDEIKELKKKEKAFGVFYFCNFQSEFIRKSHEVVCIYKL